MLPSCLLHPEKAADINASKRRGSFGFTHGKYDKYMSMVIAAQVLTCLLLLTFPYVRKVQKIFSYIIFFFRVMKLVFSYFHQTNQISTTLQQIPIRSFGVTFPFPFFFFFNLVAHFHLKYQGQLDVGLVGSVLSLYSCVYPL